MSSLSRPFWLYRTDSERLEEILEVFSKAPDNFTHVAGLCRLSTEKFRLLHDARTDGFISPIGRTRGGADSKNGNRNVIYEITPSGRKELERLKIQNSKHRAAYVEARREKLKAKESEASS